MTSATQNGLRRFAVLTAAITLLLILIGGFVTTTRTGDSISGWPFLWGRLEPGFPVEWTHRSLAMVTGLLVAVLAFWSRRPLAWAALGAVTVQALLGGVRVGKVFPVPVAIIHAVFAQGIFCAMVAMALLLSERWTLVAKDESTASASGLGIATTALAFLQLVAGAVTRHTGAGLVVHLVGAGLVLVHVALFASRLMMTPLRRGARVLLAILGVQLALGIATWTITAGGFARSHQAPIHQILAVSAHVAIGAALLATSLALTLLCHRSRTVSLKAAVA